jgi:hypothetical protein
VRRGPTPARRPTSHHGGEGGKQTCVVGSPDELEPWRRRSWLAGALAATSPLAACACARGAPPKRAAPKVPNPKRKGPKAKDGQWPATGLGKALVGGRAGDLERPSAAAGVWLTGCRHQNSIPTGRSGGGARCGAAPIGWFCWLI